MDRTRPGTATLLSLLVVGGVFAGVAGTAGADHGVEFGNYTVNLPFDSDHYPRHENPGGTHNASINHYAAGSQEAFDDIGAPDGLEELDYIVIENQDIDFSECKTENTAAFGIDRDNDDAGTYVDVDLLRYMERSQFNDHSIVVRFYDGDELGAPATQDEGGQGHGDGEGREDGDGNPELYPDDEVVAHQGYQSGGGPCYGMPVDAGWYQIQGMANGTNWQGEHVTIDLPSHYFYICACDSEEAAYETLGPPPGQDNPYEDGDQSGTTPTATATPEPTTTAEPDPGTQTPDRSTTASDATPTATEAPNQGGDGNGGGGNGGGGDSPTTTNAPATGGGSQDSQTPTIGDGPGFGAGLALVALLGAALVALRRGHSP